MLKYNKKMEGYIRSIEGTINEENIERLEMLGPTYYETNGFILIRKGDDLGELNIDKILSVFHDRTDFEASHNEFRIEDYFNEFISKPIDGLGLALKLSEIWEYKFRKDFPYYSFHIIISYDENYTTIRFHKFREEEGSWIQVNKLEGYKYEGVALRIVE
jgi:hypothetical protein